MVDIVYSENLSADYAAVVDHIEPGHYQVAVLERTASLVDEPMPPRYARIERSHRTLSGAKRAIWYAAA